jgi:hypothetical protein
MNGVSTGRKAYQHVVMLSLSLILTHHEDIWGSAFLNIGQLHPCGKSPNTCCTGGWGEPRTTLDALEKANVPPVTNRTIIPRGPACNLVTLLTYQSPELKNELIFLLHNQPIVGRAIKPPTLKTNDNVLPSQHYLTP